MSYELKDGVLIEHKEITVEESVQDLIEERASCEANIQKLTERKNALDEKINKAIELGFII